VEFLEENSYISIIPYLYKKCKSWYNKGVRIGIFDPYLDDLGGGEKYMMTIAECLSKKHEVTVFWDNKEDIKKLLQRFSLDLSNVAISKNIFFPRVSFLKRIFTTRHYDVIIILSDGSIPFSLSKKLFLHIQQPLIGISDSSIKSRLKLSRVNKIFFNSEFSRSFVPKELSKKGIVLYPPIAIHSKNLKKENIILHVGRFRVRNVGMGNYKKQDIMINTFKRMVDEGLKNWKFILAVGLQEKDTEEFKKMQESARGYSIEFMINISNEELWDIYSLAKIYWHASGFGDDLEKHPEYAEHFGISTVEAMGAGAVPVVFNAGGQREIVEDGKNGFLWDTIDSLIQKTNNVINNDKLWKALSENAVEHAKQFSYDRFCKEITKIVEV